MSGERIETANGGTWQYLPDDAPPLADRMRAIASARLIDEISLQPLQRDISVTTTRSDLYPRVSRGGLVGLVGQPARTFPGLDTNPTTIDLNITCSGFLPMALQGALGPVAGFPDAFAPLDFGDVPMHRTGVALEGRVVRRTPLSAVPLAGATVQVDALWSHPPPANWAPPAFAEAPNIVSLAPGLYRARAATTNIRQRALSPAGTAKTLVNSASPGTRRIRVSDSTSLTAGSVIMIDRDVPDRTEVIPIAAIDPTLGTDVPAWITLAHPVGWLHRAGAACIAVVPQPPLFPSTLSRAAIAGDCTAFTASAPAFTNDAFVEIDDTAPDDNAGDPEYQRVGLYQTTTDAAGYFHLPPVARVALVRLLAHHATVTDSQPIVTLDYSIVIQNLTVAME